MEIYEGSWEELEASGGPSSWDWDGLFDGRLRIAREGVDYPDEKEFLGALMMEARGRGLTFRVMKLPVSGVAFQCPRVSKQAQRDYAQQMVRLSPEMGDWIDEQVICVPSAEELKEKLNL